MTPSRSRGRAGSRGMGGAERPLNAAQRRLVQEHIRWACEVVRRLAHRYRALLSEEDAKQLATMGLSKAAQSFEPGTGVPFAGYALKAVQGAVRNAAGVEKRFHGPLLRDAISWTEQEDWMEETDADALDKLYARAGQAAAAMVFGIAGMRTHGLATGGEDEALRAIVHKRVHEALATVPERPREVIARRLLGEQDIRQVAAEMDISTSTVRRDYDEWMPKLQRRLTLAGAAP